MTGRSGKLVRELLYAGRIDDTLGCIEAQMNSVADEQEKALLRELYSYYANNKSSLLGYYDRGIAIPPTRLPGEIHHARLGSMESNVFTLIGNRMKGRCACWSINGANNLGLVLCAYHTTGMESVFSVAVPALITANDEPSINAKASAGSTPETEGHGYHFWSNGSISAAWARSVTGLTSFTEMSYT